MKLSLERDQYFDMATKLTAGKRQSYTVSDKLRIIQFAEQNGNRAAEREFGVSESNVRLWRKSKDSSHIRHAAKPYDKQHRREDH